MTRVDSLNYPIPLYSNYRYVIGKNYVVKYWLCVSEKIKVVRQDDLSRKGAWCWHVQFRNRVQDSGQLDGDFKRQDLRTA